MNYEEAMAYIHSKRSSGISLGLSRMRKLCGLLSHPENQLRFIHVAGTNGKGSVSAYISSILGVNGYLVGRYVSPAVFCYEECIQFEDSRGVSNISRELLAEVVTETAAAVTQMEKEGGETPTVFEIETAMAFLAFVKRGCQIVVLEAGLGGGEDATNVIENVVASVITPISMDHMGMLGGTIQKIAEAKAGIIREKVPVIAYPKTPEAEAVIASECKKKNTECTFVRKQDMEMQKAELRGCIFSYQGENFRTRMIGCCQMENACIAIETCRHLGEGFSFDEVQIMLGVREAFWRGRFEIVNADPLIIVDGAHNVGGAEALRDSVEMFLPGRNIHGVMGVFRDKDYRKMISVLRNVMQDVITVTAPGERGLPAGELCKAWQECGMEAEVAESVNGGLKKALERCEKGDAILLFGSLSLLSELKWR